MSVNVPLPQNAYLLKSVNTPTPIASFNDGEDMVMPSLKVAIEPQQDLSHGDPSPTNICPISGWTEANVTVADDVENPTVSHTYTIDLDGTRYGGTLDVVSGEVTVDRAYVDLGTLNYSYADNRFQTLGIKDLIKKPASGRSAEGLICSSYVASTKGESHTFFKYVTGDLYFYDSSYTSASDFKTAMNGVQLVYELATPLTIQLTPTAIKSLRGVNNVWADTGDIKDAEYFSKEV